MQQLDGKIALVTGASSGIGKETARALAKEGCNLILIGRRGERLHQLGREIETEYGREYLALVLDIRNKAEVQSSISSLPEKWQNIDILVSNAGLALGVDKMQNAELDDWEQMIDTNIKSLLYITHTILPGMVKRNRGDIVHLGSIAGHEVYPGRKYLLCH